jgi:lipopolysaccharide export system permease protein
MNLVERYIFRIVSGAFLGCLVALTGVIWITQALREMDLITGKGQTLLVFFTVTGLSLPTLVAVISPVALFIAIMFALNRLNGDSELIVMSAAGMPPGRVMRPFLAFGGIVCVIVAVLTLYVIPASFQELRDLVSKIRADFVSNIVQEGQFTTLDNGVTFHYRERAGDALLGILMQDRRDETKRVVYLAERGQTLEHKGQSYLQLENGSIHRQGTGTSGNPQSSIVTFDSYAVDLSALNQETSEFVYKPRERSTGDLLMPDRNDSYYKLQAGRFRAELHDRLTSWMFALAVVFIAFACLGDVKTTRQGRGSAMAISVVAVVGLRIAMFAASSALARSPGALVVVYGLPLGTIVLCAALIFGGPRMRAALSGLSDAALGRMTALVPRLPRAKGA